MNQEGTPILSSLGGIIRALETLLTRWQVQPRALRQQVGRLMQVKLCCLVNSPFNSIIQQIPRSSSAVPESPGSWKEKVKNSPSISEYT